MWQHGMVRLYYRSLRMCVCGGGVIVSEHLVGWVNVCGLPWVFVCG